MHKGKLIVFSAPSGAGKTSIVRYLLNKPELRLSFSVSATSRPPRTGEKNGVDYYFITQDEFQKAIDKGEFVEWEEVYHGTYYGTYKKEIQRILNEGKNVIFDIDVVGGINIKKLYPEETMAVFVKPPSVKELEKRLRSRATDSEDKIAERIAKAGKELSYESQFDISIVNDDLQKAQEEAYKAVYNFISG
jgi:guanylate kinase